MNANTQVKIQVHSKQQHKGRKRKIMETNTTIFVAGCWLQEEGRKEERYFVRVFFLLRVVFGGDVECVGMLFFKN